MQVQHLFHRFVGRKTEQQLVMEYRQAPLWLQIVLTIALSLLQQYRSHPEIMDGSLVETRLVVEA